MGGIGKTELVLQYAMEQLKLGTYPGGICWLQAARKQEIATQILSFAQAQPGFTIPDLDLAGKISYCWRNWAAGEVLIILDDVTDYNVIAPYLPPSDPRFKLLMTTRLRLGSSVKDFPVEELNEESAIALLISFMDAKRIQLQLNDVRALCQRVGNLPLGLELLGRFLARKPECTVAELLEQLASNSLAAKALIETESGMTAQLGVTEALELSWQELNEAEQELACLLGLFAVAPIPWTLVEQCLHPERDSLLSKIFRMLPFFRFLQIRSLNFSNLEDARDEGLIGRSLLKRVGEGSYQLHQIVQKYFGIKLSQRSDQGLGLKESFCRVMVAVAQNIDFTPTVDQIERVRDAIIHLEEFANQWKETLSDDNLVWPCTGVGKFYSGQGNYELALPWIQKCLEQCQQRLGNDHLSVANSLNNLAYLYKCQGRYEKAEPLYIRSLDLTRKLLGNDHPDVATSLNNLAELYRSQSRYEKAEPLYIQSLDLKRKLLGNDHPDVATSLNNLALLYSDQKRYKEAEPLFKQSLKLLRNRWGNDHPDVAKSIDNLAVLYSAQKRYEDAEPLYTESLDLLRKLLGNNHPDVDTNINNLANHYYFQKRYEEAEPLLKESLELKCKLLGNDHPDVAKSIDNLAGLYYFQKRYEDVVPLYIQSLELRRKRLSNDHPDVEKSINNLANHYYLQERYEEAEPLLKESLELKCKRLGNEHPDVAISLLYLGTLYQKQSKYLEAKDHYHQVIAIAEIKLGSNHPNTLRMVTTQA